MLSPTGQDVESSEPPQVCRQFTFTEILAATQNFDESLVIGRGGFGKVYRGSITYGAQLMVAAIKRLESTSQQGAVEFWAEVQMLSKLRHCHLVSLIGYCNDDQEMILVYDYMPNGTLEHHLHKHQVSLSWVRRLKICIGAARGLEYLHTGTGIKHGVIHRDVKSSNILLHKSWAAKISDFGLSKIGPTNQPSTYVNTLVKGTFGYLDPDYFQTGRLTRKSDVYAFGVVLFEVLCGKRAIDTSIDEDQWGLARWVQDSIKKGRLKKIVDSNIMGSISPKCLKEFAQLAVRCLHSNPKRRPTMAEETHKPITKKVMEVLSSASVHTNTLGYSVLVLNQHDGSLGSLNQSRFPTYSVGGMNAETLRERIVSKGLQYVHPNVGFFPMKSLAASICEIGCHQRKVEKRWIPPGLLASWISTEHSFQIKTLKPDHKCSRNYNLGSLVTYKWIAYHMSKEILNDLFIPYIKMKSLIKDKFLIDVSLGQCKRAKQRALFNHEGGLIEHYGRLWDYQRALLDSNPGSTCELDVEETSYRRGDAKNKLPVCGFRLLASWISTEHSFQIKTLKPDHKCSRNYNLGSLVTYKWIAYHMSKEILNDLFIPYIKMKSLIKDKFLIDVSLGQCKRAKQRALFNHEGGLIEHYASSTMEQQFYARMDGLKLENNEAYEYLKVKKTGSITNREEDQRG
ncbi:serine-threonine/tyrosine-protein kinase catalytic domain-containing protein [Artemisia annua]|uniref:Serine-threonine/tyrosine-protein kinase catalytic domain-containing protein n=1 Tax=Artemisia annua TaxID=35608 RepID=A0A2U1M4F2_ARTAN|nr:serine-threonine/tyrosine-protein kinase catalytic domain-containing protein [Artemisia annua]